MKIGFFDSGMGGLTVLSEALKRLPNHEYLYYADTMHAPYGPKPKDEVRAYVFEAIECLVKAGAEVIVIACNTATSIAVADLRKMYQLPIIGMEPAVKPAIGHVKDSMKRVLVTATPLTVKEEKLRKLIKRLDGNHQTDLLPLPELVRFAEGNEFSEAVVMPYLMEALEPYELTDYGAIVLGCTHFPLFKEQFAKIFGSEVFIVDGAEGTVSHLKTLVESNPSLNASLTFYRSGKQLTTSEELEPYLRILRKLKAI